MPISDMSTPIGVASPVVVSASRSTDIPAFYADWFFTRLDAGYSFWTNPFNGKTMRVSYADTRFIVFWSKNPAPLLRHLDTLKQKGIGCYIQYTLNDYASEGYEPYVPPLESRINTFFQLSRVLGKHAVIWRNDPLMLTQDVGIDELLVKIRNIGDRLQGYTDKLVFSFVDIATYKKVRMNLSRKHIPYRDWTLGDMRAFAEGLKELNISRGWGYDLATCCEAIDLDSMDISHNRCVDERIMARIAHKDNVLMQHLGYEITCEQPLPLLSGGDVEATHVALGNGLYAVKTRKARNRDSGQRNGCGCVKSKDIGEYNTCRHLCVYCYANGNDTSVLANCTAHERNPDAPSITGKACIDL